MIEVNSVETGSALGEERKRLLECVVYGYNEDEICDLLDLEVDEKTEFRETLEGELRSEISFSDLRDLIKKCFENKLISTYDFTDESVKSQANKYAKRFFAQLFLRAVTHKDRKQMLVKDVLQFIKSCDMMLNNKKHMKPKKPVIELGLIPASQHSYSDFED